MTSLRKRLDAALSTLEIIQGKLENCHGYPPCCLTFHNGNRISCDVLGPMPEKVFLRYCGKCRKTMRELLDHVGRFHDREL